MDAFAAKGLVGAVGHIERFNPALQSLRKRIADGELGEVYQIATRRQGPFPARIADVGVVKDLGTHDIDLTAWLAQSRFESIFAQTTTRSGRPHEDMVAATGKLANGVITNHLVNWLSPMKERLTIVTGEKGAFVADTVTADLTFYRERHRRHRMGVHGRVPGRLRGQCDPAGHRQAGAAAHRTRSVP